jgi:hypothetical protein
MLQTTTLKRNLVPEIGEARKKVGIGLPRCLPPLKETFVGSLGPWFDQTHLSVDLHWVIF